MSYQPPYGAPPGGQYPPQQQYGAPPPQQYGQQPPYGQPQQQYAAPQGPPPNQYGAPSPQPPYGAPPSQYAPPAGPPLGQYGAPPVPYGSQPAYGAPSPQPPYGAPPQQAYGAPPGPPPGQYGAASSQPPYGGQQPQYGAPPPQQYGQPTPYGAPQQNFPPDQPSVGYSSQPPRIQWDATADAKALRKAMKGFGTDEKALIAVLCNKDPLQINVLRDTYNRNERRDLLADLKSELGGDLEDLLMGIARGPLLQDCHVLRESMKGMGTVEEGLTDVLMGRNNADIAAIKQAYMQTYKRTLEADIKSDLSMKTEQHFMMVLAGNRAPQSAPVDHQKVESDVTELYNATDGKMGTDEIKVCDILTHRNDEQIRAIAWTYQQRYTRSLETVIASEFSGHMKHALIHQLRTATDKAMRDAKLLEATMAGMGTKERLLLNRVIRTHWDRQHMQQVQGAYQKEYKRSLKSRIEGETSGDFERALVACLVR